MNANELADDAEGLAKQLEKFWIAELITKCATMLRQQQIEIEALKKQIPDWENIRKPNPYIGNLDKEPYVYKMGDIDWTKALK
jgi:hypothetical protein